MNINKLVEAALELKLFDLAGIHDFEEEYRAENKEKLLNLAITLADINPKESERAFKLALLFED